MTGQRMTQPQFHRLYEQMPDEFTAELVDGVVFVAEPVGADHADGDSLLSTVLGVYAARTAGVKARSNVTVILGRRDQVQPDACLCIEPEYGGQTRLTYRKKYLRGGPELVVEIALSSRSIDMGTKRLRYAKAGVLEYVVLCLMPSWQLHWFDLPGGRLIAEDEGGVFRSAVFPGLCIDGRALVEGDYARVLDTLDQGLSSKEHQNFVDRLNRKRQSCTT